MKDCMCPYVLPHNVIICVPVLLNVKRKRKYFTRDRLRARSLCFCLYGFNMAMQREVTTRKRNKNKPSKGNVVSFPDSSSPSDTGCRIIMPKHSFLSNLFCCCLFVCLSVYLSTCSKTYGRWKPPILLHNKT